MKYIGFLFLLLCFGLFFTSTASAASCSHGSTQSRIQPNDKIPWTQTLTVGCDRSFRIGGFHDGTGLLSPNVNVQVVGPNTFGAYFPNGDNIKVPYDGTYSVIVRTNNQEGPGCTETSTVHVQCFSPTPTPVPVQTSQCPYFSTQARVQNSITVPWQQTISVSCDRVFTVGSFHNATGQFVTDTSLLVVGPGINGYYANGHQVKIPDTISTGNYSVYVNTNGKTGASCSEQAIVSFSCVGQQALPTMPTVVVPGQCPYISTEAKVQRIGQTNWEQRITLGCSESFAVGSFHNGQGTFATDTALVVTDPKGFTKTGITNGQKIRAFFPGLYTISTVTLNQTGPSCQNQTTVTATCQAPEIPDWWTAVLRQFMVW